MAMALGESPSRRVGRLGVPSRRSAGQAYTEQTFFAQSTVPARKLLARELATVVAGILSEAGILSGRGFVRQEFCQEGILSGRGFVRQGFCQAGILSGRDFVRKGFCQAGILPGRDFVRKEFCQEGILSGSGGSGLCQEGESALELCVLSTFFFGGGGKIIKTGFVG